MKLFSVNDTKAQAYMQPVAMRTTAEGLRAFESDCKDPASQFAKHPSDFIFCELGEWNELTGEIKTYDKPTILATASDYVH